MRFDVRENALPTNLLYGVYRFRLVGLKASCIYLSLFFIYSSVHDLSSNVGEFIVYKRIGSIPKSLCYQ